MGSPPDVVPACVWSISAELVLALDERFGEPVDAYVNGAQVWLRDDGPGGAALEWRLHPVAGFRQPDGVSHHDLLASVVYALRAGEDPPSPPEALWDGLEAFPGYGDELEPATAGGGLHRSTRVGARTRSAWSTTPRSATRGRRPAGSCRCSTPSAQQLT